MVLVNGYPIQEINIHMGLKRGDILANFLFLLVVDGLSGLVYMAIDLGLNFGFLVGSHDLVINHFHYADDTLFIWIIKAII